MYRQFNIRTILRSAHAVYLCVLCGSENKQQLFPYTELFVKAESISLSGGTNVNIGRPILSGILFKNIVLFDCTCNTQNSLLLNHHNGDDAPQDLI